MLRVGRGFRLEALTATIVKSAVDHMAKTDSWGVRVHRIDPVGEGDESESKGERTPDVGASSLLRIRHLSAQAPDPTAATVPPIPFNFAILCALATHWVGFDAPAQAMAT